MAALGGETRIYNTTGYVGMFGTNVAVRASGGVWVAKQNSF